MYKINRDNEIKLIVCPFYSGFNKKLTKTNSDENLHFEELL